MRLVPAVVAGLCLLMAPHAAAQPQVDARVAPAGAGDIPPQGKPAPETPPPSGAQPTSARRPGYDSFAAPRFQGQLDNQQSGYLGAFEGATPGQPAERVEVAPGTIAPPAGRLPPPAQASPPAAATKDRRVPDGAPR
jgi:hypothetical protein